MGSKLCILVCENLEREVTAAIESEGFDDVMVVAFPANCDPPGIGWDAFGEVIRAREDGCSQICLLGGCCIAGLGDPLAELEYCRVHQVDMCFDPFISRDIIEGYLKDGAYLLTPGWLARWRQSMEEWGFDQERAREYFGESMTRLVLLDTGVDAQSSERLLEFADFIGLPFETVPVGLDFFKLFLTKIVLEWRLEVERSESMAALTITNRQSAEYAMAFDLIGSLTGIMTEAQAIESILDLFAMLFAPGKLTYMPVEDGKPGKAQSRSSFPLNSAAVQDRLTGFAQGSDSQYARTELGNGFLLRIGRRNETLGVLEVDEIAFPQYREHYLNLALSIVGVCGLAIDNARTYQQIKRAEEALKEYSERLEELVEERTKELRDAHEQLVRREKLAVLGQMAGMVAHELRNPLATISNAVFYLKIVLPDAEETVKEYLEIIIQTVRDSDRIISDLLDFSRTRVPDRQKVAVSELVADVMGKRPPPENVEVAIEIAADLSPVYVDRHQMNQVLDNLVTNAYQAMIEGGSLTVSAQAEEGQVRLAVTDTGVGIPEENMAKLFEPLFTTRAKGLGLGLMVVKSLVEANEGSIEVESETGKGSTFTMRLPMAAPSALHYSQK